MSADLSEAKQNLLDKLGPNYGMYIQLLGRWFRGLITKKEFDKSAKQLVEQNFVLEHNKFWLAFFHHCANSSTHSLQSHHSLLNDPLGKHFNAKSPDQDQTNEQVINNLNSQANQFPLKAKCLPNKLLTHMKIFVIAWEMGLDTADDHVSSYVIHALHHFLKNIITEVICTKTAYRLREERFKYAIGVKPMNPYLGNSLKIYSSNLEYDPYQIESGRMNSSLVDTYAYNDSLFPSRLHEAQALYEYACSTTSISEPRNIKRIRLSEIFMQENMKSQVNHENENDGDDGDDLNQELMSQDTAKADQLGEENNVDITPRPVDSERRLTLYHLLIAFLSNRTIIPSHSLYSLNLERILTKLTS